MKVKKINRIMLTQPNYAWFGGRTFKLLPYGLGLLNACLKKESYDSWIYDPNFLEHSQGDVRNELRITQPDAVAVSSWSTESINEVRELIKIIREELPRCTIILGGIIPTVSIEEAMKNFNANYYIIGEGEVRLPSLINALNNNPEDIKEIDGLAQSEPRLINKMTHFIENLDDFDCPDYGGLDVVEYANHPHKYAHALLPREFPYATIITSRGCPYQCIFCSAALVSGKKVRFRSASNVLKEIDDLYNKYNVKEIIFLDDHFLSDKNRAMELMEGLIERNYNISWKCVNVAVWSLNKDILSLMQKSGCYQITISPESGNQTIVKNIIKKPVNLKQVIEIVNIAKALNFEIVANFVFGLPDETFEQIRETFDYASRLNVDIVNFHIATPLPGTRLMEICTKQGYLINETKKGYTTGSIQTEEFTPFELRVLRSFEWDRINFFEKKRKEIIARMEGLSIEELERWRKNTRRELGTIVNWKEIS